MVKVSNKIVDIKYIAYIMYLQLMVYHFKYAITLTDCIKGTLTDVAYICLCCPPACHPLST